MKVPKRIKVDRCRGAMPLEEFWSAAVSSQKNLGGDPMSAWLRCIPIMFDLAVSSLFLSSRDEAVWEHDGGKVFLTHPMCMGLT